MNEILRYTAFTTDPATGNPAGVVLDANLTVEQMQTLAADIGFSETAFIFPARTTAAHDVAEVTDKFSVRYFSPLAEVAFCGHATIASAVALAERGAEGTLRFDTQAGAIDVTLTESEGRPMATLTSVETSSSPVEGDVLAEALTALNWSVFDLDPRFPPHVAFAGNDHLILAARSRQRLRELDYDFEALKAIMEREGWTTIQLFWPETPDLVHSRNPFPVGGVVEDPATGAAAAALGGYFLSLGEVSTDREILIIQGEDMGRRSELTLSLTPRDLRARVSGTAVSL